MAVNIRIYGTVPDRLELTNPLVQAFSSIGPLNVSFGTETDKATDDAVVSSDVILCFLTGPDPQKNTGLLKRIVMEHGAWAYLTTVAVCKPNDATLTQFLIQLGVSRIIPAILPIDLTYDRLAEEVRRVHEASWWHGEAQGTFPAFVVNRKGAVLRANASAKNYFPELEFGASFSKVIEGQDGDLPEQHPIVTCIDQVRKQALDHTLIRETNRRNRFFLMCNPIHRPRKNIAVAGVWLLDISRSMQIIEASKNFDQANDRDDLYRRIVTQAGLLGFKRARLYEFIERERRLYGRASIGFDSAKSVDFTRFTIDVGSDPTSKITLYENKAMLHLPNAEQARRTELTNSFVGLSKHAEQMLKPPGLRWIEAPIWLPEAQAGRATAWGKLSVDLGDPAASLDARDVGDVAMFCSVVGHAIAAMVRREKDRDYQLELQATSEEISEALKKDGDVLPNVVQIVLRLFQRLSNASIAVYRIYDPTSPTAIRIGAAEFREESFKTLYAVPHELSLKTRMQELFGRLFGEKKDSEPRPYIVPIKPGEPLEALNGAGKNLPPLEQNYLRDIRSEVHIPVFQGKEVTGVIVLVSMANDAFPESFLSTARQLMHVVSTWLELGRRHDAQRWVEQVLRELIELLPELAAVKLDNDDAFFAGVATLLSAHTGLRWNRVFIMSCHARGAPPETMELVYALGGLANARSSHQYLQDAVKSHTEFQTLRGLLKSRLVSPAPDFHPEPGAENLDIIRDELYQLCVADPRAAGKPLRLRYLEKSKTPEPSTSEQRPIDVAHPLQRNWIVTSEYLDAPNFPEPMVVPFNLESLPSAWVERMNGKYPGIFAEGKPIYRFPLWSAANGYSEPLGVVMVDMQAQPEYRIEDMNSATQVLLGLVADLLAARNQNRRMRGWIKALPVLNHGRTLKTIWDQLYYPLRELLGDLSSSNVTEIPVSVLENISKSVMQLFCDPMRREFVQSLVNNISERVKRIDSPEWEVPPVADVGKFFDTLKEHYAKHPPAGLSVAITCDPSVNGLPLPCDELVLKDAITCLLENSSQAVKGSQRRHNATIHVTMQESKSCPEFPRFVIIRYEDDGPGIPDDCRDAIFIDGFTLFPSNPGKGRGLALTRAQLIAYHGDIQLRQTPVGECGARFEIRLGVPASFRMPSKGVPNVATDTIGDTAIIVGS